jgi:hypothetical protein|tara:strand:+ start:19 stop:192 length:174 start_codon:yes stop_codon:yes gene_type:complete
MIILKLLAALLLSTLFLLVIMSITVGILRSKKNATIIWNMEQTMEKLEKKKQELNKK